MIVSFPVFWQWQQSEKTSRLKKWGKTGKGSRGALLEKWTSVATKNATFTQNPTWLAWPRRFPIVAFCSSDVQCAINRCVECASASCQSAIEEALSYDTKIKMLWSRRRAALNHPGVSHKCEDFLHCVTQALIKIALWNVAARWSRLCGTCHWSEVSAWGKQRGTSSEARGSNFFFFKKGGGGSIILR